MSEQVEKFHSKADFEVLEEIAQGGMGKILRVLDHSLSREVALKVLHIDPASDPQTHRRFLREAQITGILEHPNIVPVHHVGVSDAGRHFFTMKLVQGQSLGAITAQLRQGMVRLRERYNRMRLMNILTQVCMAISYAHSKGVIHRDIKPHNIMIGEFGEVLMMDWGLAKQIDESDEPVDGDSIALSIDDFEDPFATQSGVVFGTPAYMSPEQASGKVETVDRYSDVYALGAIMYELLTYHPPFPGRLDLQNLHRIRNEDPPRPRVRAPTNDVPEALEAICMRALSKRKEERYGSAAELAAEIEAYLAGTREAERRLKEAQLKTDQGQQFVHWFDRLNDYAHVIERETSKLRRSLPRSAERTIEQRRELWNLQDLKNRVIRYSAQMFSLAEQKFAQALGEQANFGEARSALARMYWNRYERALQQRDEVLTITYANLVLKVDDGYYSSKMVERCRLSVSAIPQGANAHIVAVQEVDRQLQPTTVICSGTTPLEDVRLGRGRYLVHLKLPGHVATIYPLLVEREQELLLPLTLFPRREVGHGFCYVPAGYALLGGDPLFPENEQRRAFVADFFIAQYPVSVEDYFAFLVDKVGSGGAQMYLPAPLIDGREVYQSTGKGLQINSELFSDPTIARRTPIFGVSWHSARAYCQWRSEQEGVNYRLPTGNEWEKAARGADGRIYPWGDSFDASFCNNRQSNRSAVMPASPESYPADRSPYGVKAMAGVVREWCSDAMSGEEEIKQQRGGGWNLPTIYCRTPFVDGSDPVSRHPANGFRLCRGVELPAELKIPEYLREAAELGQAFEREEPLSAGAQSALKLFAFDQFKSVLREVKEQIRKHQGLVSNEERAIVTPESTDGRRQSGILLQALLEKHQTRPDFDDATRFGKVQRWSQKEAEEDLARTTRDRPIPEVYLKYESDQLDDVDPD